MEVPSRTAPSWLFGHIHPIVGLVPSRTAPVGPRTGHPWPWPDTAASCGSSWPIGRIRPIVGLVPAKRVRGRFLARFGPVPRALTLVEVLVALAILGICLTPIFMVFSESRQISVRSLDEMRATGMASSMIDGLKRIPGASLTEILGREFSDDSLPAGLSLDRLGVPTAPADLRRVVSVNVVNQPILPDERFSNPWGRVAEIDVKVSREDRTTQGHTKVLAVKGYRFLDGSP